MTSDPSYTFNLRMILTVLKRGMGQRCPRCGQGKLYARWNILEQSCVSCGLDIERRGADTWFFTYMSTAFLTGLIILFMLLYSFTNYVLGHSVIITVWLVLIVFTLPYRKALAISIDYLLEKYSETIEGNGSS